MILSPGSCGSPGRLASSRNDGDGSPAPTGSIAPTAMPTAASAESTSVSRAARASGINPIWAIRNRHNRRCGRRGSPSAAISVISACDSSKSKIAKFSASRSIRLVRGMTTMPCCTRKRRHTCAAVLPCALPMRASTLSFFNAAAGDRAVGDDRHAVPAAGRDHLGLVEKRMHLDLVADQRLARQCTASSTSATVKFETPIWRASPSRLTLHSAPSVSASGILRIGPMQQQQIDLGQPQPHQALLGRAFEIARRQNATARLGGDEDFVALDAGRRAAPRRPRARCRTSRAVSMWR